MGFLFFLTLCLFRSLSATNCAFLFRAIFNRHRTEALRREPAPCGRMKGGLAALKLAKGPRNEPGMNQAQPAVRIFEKRSKEAILWRFQCFRPNGMTRPRDFRHQPWQQYAVALMASVAASVLGLWIERWTGYQAISLLY